MLTKAQALQDELVRLRRDIHQHPELSFQEFRTAALVADTLREIGGIEIKTEVGTTQASSARLAAADGPTIAIRADMDALPIQSITGVPFESTNPGVMHACGHDAHTAILLGVAHLLRQSFAEETWHGNVRLLFQPSEEAFDENGVSGATAMITDGALEGLDAVLALHVASHRPAGEMAFSDGYSLAAVDSFEAWIRGDGGHGAYPHTGSDPLYMLSAVLPALYAIPSRQIDPLSPCVVSLGQISGGAAPNVIPDTVYLQGTIRSMDDAVRSSSGLRWSGPYGSAKTWAARWNSNWSRATPRCSTTPASTTGCAAAARDVVGADAVVEQKYGMGAEDFSYMCREAPGAMFMLGAATARRRGAQSPYAALRHRRIGHGPRGRGPGRDGPPLCDRAAVARVIYP